METKNRRLLTIGQLAQELQISVRTLRRYRAQGMPHIPFSSQVVRYDLEEVIAWIRGRRDL